MEKQESLKKCMDTILRRKNALILEKASITFVNVAYDHLSIPKPLFRK
jgi:hypothetical protein